MYSEGFALAFDLRGSMRQHAGGRSPRHKCSDTELEKILKICYNRHKEKTTQHKCMVFSTLI